MSSYLFVALNFQSMDWIADYVTNVPSIIRRFGGEYMLVSKTLRHVEGNGPQPDQIAIFTFPSQMAIDDFLDAPDYAPYKAARMASSTADIFAIKT